MADVLQKLRKENEICALKGWRDEVIFCFLTQFVYSRQLALFTQFMCMQFIKVITENMHTELRFKLDVFAYHQKYKCPMVLFI